MAYSQRQETQIKVGAFIYNGGYRAFEDYPLTSREVWNIRAESRLEYLNGTPIVEALDGFGYSNAEGFRLYMDFELNNIYNSTAQLAWRSLFNQFASFEQRTFWNTTANGAGTSITSLVLQSDAPTTDDYFNGCVVTSLAGGDVVITDYVGSTRTCTLASAKTWLTGATITIKVNANFPTILGAAINDESADVQYYNIESNVYGVLRDLTIGRQIISVTAKSVERVSTIPESFVNYG